MNPDLRNLIDQFNQWAEHHRDRITLGFLALLFLWFAIFMFGTAIRHTDTDLWFHLAGGRYLFEHGQLFNGFYYSYLPNPRPFINYFWGFQAMVFLLWESAGPVSLIVVKGAMFLVGAFFCTRLLLQDRSLQSAGFFHLLVLLLILYVMTTKGDTVRPHVVSYTLIPVFLYILLYREKWFPLLPLLTVVWANLHGIEWVIGALMCGSWVLQRGVNWLEHRDPATLKPMVWVLACAPALLVNPNGIKVLATPFLHSPDLSLFILELGPINLSPMLDFRDGLNVDAAITILLIVNAIAFLRTMVQPRLHLFQLITAIGGFILVMRGNRFAWEWLLLTTPLFGLWLSSLQPVRTNTWTCAGLIVMMTMFVSASAPTIARSLAHYPYHETSLPWGTTQFIEKLKIKGRYLAPPSYAGYIEWRLSPGVKIHSDMQFPVFVDLEFHAALAPSRYAVAFIDYVATYQPELIGIRKSMDQFRSIAATQQRYVPVFFDHLIVLYLDRDKYPEIAAAFELKHVNPFDQDVVAAAALPLAIMELQRMLTLVPDAYETVMTLVGFLIEAGHLDEAEQYLRTAMARDAYPSSGHFLQGKIHHARGDCAAALTSYERVVPEKEDDKYLLKPMASCYFAVGDHKAAFEYFGKTVRPYHDFEPDLLTYYQYAISAIAVGDTAKGARLLTMTKQFDDGSNPDLSALIAQLLLEISP